MKKLYAHLFSSLLKAFALLTVLLLCGHKHVQAQGAVTGETKIYTTGEDSYGSFVQFLITTVDASTADFWIATDATISVRKTGVGPYEELFSYPNTRFISDINEISVAASKAPGIFIAAFDGTLNWEGFIGPFQAKTVKDEDGNDYVQALVRWYIPQDYLEVPLAFNVSMTYKSLINGNELTFYKDFQYKGEYWFSIPNPISEPALNWKFSDTPGKMAVSYAFDDKIGLGSDDRNTVYHWLTAYPDKVESTVEPHSGSIDVDPLDEPFTHTFHTRYEGENLQVIYTREGETEVPAYIWPDTLIAVYKDRDSVTLSWEVPPAPGEDQVTREGDQGDYIGGDAFEVERSTDPDFKTNIKTVTDSYAYDKDAQLYTIEDDLGDLEGGFTVYYRLRRTATADKWGWGAARETSVPIKINTILKPKDVELSDGTNGPAAKITWEGFEGVWLEGIEFHIKKLNLTKGTPPEIINITEKEARNGEYVDENITYCNEFVYSLVLDLGGNYPSPEETEVPGSILVADIGTIKNLNASKGYFPDRTELRWSAEGVFDSYIVKRRVYGSDENFVQIATVSGSSTAGDIQTDDSKGIPGVYYEYQVVGAVNCNNVTRYSRDTLYAVGFRSPTGTIYGRITYENGQPVEDVAVRLESADDSRLGQSVYLSGNADSYLKIDSLNTPFADSAFTVEAWIRPDDDAPAGQVLFSQAGQYELGFNAAGQLYFRYKNKAVTGAYTNQNQSFVHLAGIYGRDSLGLMLNDSLIAVIPCPSQPGGSPDTTVYIGGNAAGSNFKGYIDEMRVWNMALTPRKVERDYTRLMAGNEPGLAAYWRFDETVKDQFYDISNSGSSYHKNDGILASGAQHSATVPTPGQLSLKAYTDATGNYMISGIPYTGNGTTYTIVPLLGTHQFGPTSVNRLISSSSSEFTVNFKDKSSFPVSGYVYYHNTTVPVKGVQFQIDGKYAQKENGELIETDAFGKFTISVPVGFHEVKAVKSNHVFSGGGKITNRFGGNLNYQGPVSERILYDSTTVRFIGRVAGGPVQGSLPLGHSLSRNNLGEKLSITMKLAGPDRKLKLGDDDSLVTVKHLLPSNQNDPSEAHETGVKFREGLVTITPDPITGEFAVDLIPENFNVTSVTATGHSSLNLPGDFPVNVNLTDKYFTETEVHSYTDSTKVGDTTWSYIHYSDTVFYNYSYKFLERNIPTIEVTQVDGSGKKLPYFGDDTVTISLLNTEQEAVPVYNRAEDSYLFGYPVFTQNRSYRLKVSAYEQYEYYEEDDLLEPAFTDRVPTGDGVVSFANDLRYGDSTSDTLGLDENGEGFYEFQAGTPELSDGEGRKGFSVSVDIGGLPPILWKGGARLEGYIIGGEKTGNDFVTAGPNNVMAVLRDPPGSNSYAYYEAGTSITTEKEYAGAVTQSGSEEANLLLGSSIITFVGLGAGKIDETKVENSVGVKLSHSETYSGKNKSTGVTEFLTRYQTSSDPTYVGADADLFIGNSTNFTYGSTLNLAIVKNEEVKPGSDDVFFEGDDQTGYSIVKRTGINISQEFGTHFVYTAKYIEETLIPNIVRIRNGIFWPSTTTAEDAQQAADNTKKQIYVSKLAHTDPHYGATNGDTDAFGAAAKDEPWYDGSSYEVYFPSVPGSGGTIPLPGFNETDTIMVLNQHIERWKSELRKNEEAKVKAHLLQKNYSFTGGGDVAHVFRTSESERTENNFNIILGTQAILSTGTAFNKTGVKFTINEGISTSQGGNFSETTDNTQTFGFVLSESSLDYLSVDVLKAEDSSFVFKTKGGETACPYEGATFTRYYSPGTILDQPTMRAEAPGITVTEPVASDIPSTRNASYSIQLQNASETDRGVSFFLQVLEPSNPDGAKIYMDGAPLATGRAVWINAGQVLHKTITLERGPEAMEYENVQLRLISECDTASFDIINISAYFIPSCSDVHIQSPSDQWLLNTQSPVNEDGERFLPIEMDGFDLSNDLFGYIELKYRALASPIWTSVVKFYADSAAYEEGEGAKEMITGNKISYNLVMSDAAFSDQQYEIKAVAVCMDDGQLISTTESNIIRGTKDTYRPRLFGSPQPAGGVLTVSDEIRLNFNETIAAGLLSYPNFQVTGIRNGSRGDHSVSVRLDGQGDHLATEFNKNLEGKDITVEMWVLPGAPGGSPSGTLFSHGDINQSMELAFAPGNYLEVTVGETVVKSEAPVPYQPGQWAHLALVYDAAASTVSAFYNFTEVIHAAPVAPYSGNGHFEFGRSIGKQGNTFAGAMHEARIWTEVLSGTQLQVNSLKRLSGGENGLLGYYPMTEGKGGRAFDKAHGAHAQLHGDWTTPPGKAAVFNGNGYLKLSTGTSPVTTRMDYTMELWFKAEPGQGDAALASNGKGDGTDNGGSRSLFFLGFEDGLLTYRNNGVKVQARGNYLDNDWHHVAIAVNRNSGTAQLFVDGVLNQYFDAGGLGGIEAPFVYLGVRAWHAQEDAAAVSFDRHFKGRIDEFRLWNTYLNATLVSNNSNVRLKGDELGLMLYYPFENYVEHQNNMELAFTLADQKIQEDPATDIPDAEPVNVEQTDDKAPIKDRGPVDNLQFDYVVNDDGLIINLLEPRQAIDKTIVTFRVEEVRDLNGNMLESPVTWTAYIDRNQLSWSEDVFELSKELYAPLEFEAHILNSGGTQQQFTLDNLPAWLKAVPSSGTVDPQGDQKVVFTVDEGLNTGTYDEIVYMRNDDGETQSLTLNLKVQGQAPDWEVNPEDFEYSMTVYGKIRINNIFSSDPDDLLAAFSGGTCVGVTRNVYNGANDLWYAFLTVYSDAPEHNGLEFRLWDASSGQTFKAVPSTGVAFVSGAIVGTAGQPVVFDGEELLFQEISLNQGWNWISFNLAGPNMDNIQATLAGGQWQPGDVVKNEELGFNDYSSFEGWVGTLEGFNNRSLFMLRTAAAQQLSISGIPPDIANTPIPVNGGRWNYISYLPRVNMTVQEALAGYVATDEDVIKSQTGFAMYDSQTGWVGNLTYLEPGKGYMLYRKAADDVTFYYPGYGGLLAAAESGPATEQVLLRSSGSNAAYPDIPVLNVLQSPVASNYRFAGNMTVVAAVEGEFELRPGDELLAYVNGELRGKAQQVAGAAKGRPRFFINIAGEEEAPVHFEIMREGRVLARSSTVISYRSGGRTGTPEHPLVVRIESEKATVIMYPNPFSSLISISGEIHSGEPSGSGEGRAAVFHQVQLKVYDVTGGLIFEGAPEQISGNRFSLSWNGRNAGGQPCRPGVYFIHAVIDGAPISGKVIKTDSPK